MDFTEWKNEDDIVEAEKELQSVDSSYYISMVSGAGIACQVGTVFPQKGKMNDIKQLKSMGWLAGSYKVEGGKRWIRMVKPLKKYKDETVRKENTRS